MSGHNNEAPEVSSGWSPLIVRLYWAATVLLVGVVAYHGVRSAATHWLPVGDDAFLTVRSRAVFSAHPPLLSSASSAGADAAATYNHPGPAVLWFTAPFVKVLGSSGMALGVAALNCLAMAAVAVTARRAARPALAAGILACSAGLAWSMGSQVLVDPWNPHVATLALLAGLIGAWGVWQGWRPAAPIGMAAAAVAAQTHLSFVAVSALAAVVLLSGVVVGLARTPSGSRERLLWWRWGVGALVAGVALLLPTIVEQVSNGSDGNLARILDGSGGGDAVVTVAPSQAASVAAAVLSRPPWFLRGSWGMSMYAADLPSATATAVGLGVVTAVVLAGAVLGVRRRDGAVLGIIGLGSAAVIVGTVVSLVYPLRVGVPIAYYRWLWPAAVLIAAGLLVPLLEAVARAAAGRTSELVGSEESTSELVGSEKGWRAVVASSGATFVSLVAVVVFGFANIPVANDDLAGSGLWGQELSLRVLDQAAPALRDLDGPVEVVPSLQEGPLLAFTGALIDDLDAQGIDVRSSDPVIVQQVGEQHRATGEEPWVLVMVGPDTSDDAAPRGGERIATVNELDPSRRQALERDVRAAQAELEGATAELTAEGRASGDQALADLAGPITNPDMFIHDRVLADALDHDLLRVRAGDGSMLAPGPLAELSRRAFHADGRTFSLWLVPRAEWEKDR